MKVGKFIWKEGLEGPSTYNSENISPGASFRARAHLWADCYEMEWFGGSEVPLFSKAKAAKGRRTGALSSGCSRDSFQAATTSRDTLSCNAVRTKVPRPLQRDAKTLNLRAEALGTESPRGALFRQAPNRHKTPQAHLGGPGRPATPKAPEPGVPHREALSRLPPSQTPAASLLLPETSLLSKGGGKPWAFR